MVDHLTGTLHPSGLPDWKEANPSSNPTIGHPLAPPSRVAGGTPGISHVSACADTCEYEHILMGLASEVREEKDHDLKWVPKPNTRTIHMVPLSEYVWINIGSTARTELRPFNELFC